MSEHPISHRVKAFCDWLDTIPPTPPFHQQPQFRFFADLTSDEIQMARQEMLDRAEEAESLAAYLEAVGPEQFDGGADG